MYAECMGTASVARILGVTPSRVRQLADAGRIRTERTVEGIRLYSPAAVAEYLATRTPRRRTAGAADAGDGA
jgi:DNA-binding transcriptional MerR regulator